MDTQNRLDELMNLLIEAQAYGYDEYIYDMDKFNEQVGYFYNDSWDIVRAIHHGDFMPYHNYFEVDVYGQLYSYSDSEMIERLESIEEELKDFIKEMSDL